MTKPSRTFEELISLVETNRKEWIEHAPVASDVEVSRRSESLTVRLTKEEDDALDLAAKRLGIAKSSLVRVILRQYLGLSGGMHQAASSGSVRPRSDSMVRVRDAATNASKLMRDGRVSHAAKSTTGGSLSRHVKTSRNA